MSSTNPLEKLFKDLDEVQEQLQNKIDDFLIGCFTNEARIRISQQMDNLKFKKNLIESKIQRAQIFFTEYAEKKQRPGLPRRLKERYLYFLNNLEQHTFQYSPPEAHCAYCGRLETSRTGVVFTLDPISNELEDICSNCYIERKNQ